MVRVCDLCWSVIEENESSYVFKDMLLCWSCASTLEECSVCGELSWSYCDSCGDPICEDHRMDAMILHPELEQLPPYAVLCPECYEELDKKGGILHGKEG